MEFFNKGIGSAEVGSLLTILHNVTDDPCAIEVTPPTFCTFPFYYGYLNIVSVGTKIALQRTNLNAINVLVVPYGAEYLIPKSEHEEVVHYFFSKVVVDTENLIFSPIWIESSLKLS